MTVNDSKIVWGSTITALINFAIVAAVIYFVVVVPMHRLFDRLARGEEPHPVGPTQLELLVEIRDLLRAQQGLPPVEPADGKHSPPPAREVS